MTDSMNHFFAELHREAARLDETDPLKRFRDDFVFSDDESSSGPAIYLDGNSLGRLPKRTVSLLADAVERQWGQRLIRNWNEGWWQASHRIGGKIAKLIGAEDDEVILADSTSVNLFKLVAAFAEQLQPIGRVVMDASAFPTDGYIVESALKFAGADAQIEWVEIDVEGESPVPSTLKAAFESKPKLAVLCHVDFRTGYRFDIEAVNRIARTCGTKVIWDLSHSVGVVPIDAKADGMDAAVGCTYKFLNGGPGAPAFIQLARSLQNELQNPIAGWFGHASPFAMSRDYEPARGLPRFLTGTPQILSTLAIEPGVELTLEAGVAELSKKSTRMYDFLSAALREVALPFGCTIATPTRHGSHLALRHPFAKEICRALIAASVIPDFRPPDLIRFGLAPIYNSFAELAEAARRLHYILETESWRQAFDSAEGIVT